MLRDLLGWGLFFGSILIVGIHLGFYRGLLPFIIFFIAAFYIPNLPLFVSILGIKFCISIVSKGLSTTELSLTEEPFVPCESLVLNSGDIIQFERTSFKTEDVYLSNIARQFTHFGVYYVNKDGEGTVLHLTHSDGKGVVRTDSLQVAAHGYGKCRINNLKKLAEHLGYSPGTLEDILERGKDFSRNPRYDLMEGNCEHFVTYLVYGKPFSSQTDDAYNAFVREFMSDFFTVLVLYMGLYFTFQVPIIRESCQEVWSREVLPFLGRHLVSLERGSVWINDNETFLHVLIAMATVPVCLWYFGMSYEEFANLSLTSCVLLIGIAIGAVILVSFY